MAINFKRLRYFFFLLSPAKCQSIYLPNFTSSLFPVLVGQHNEFCTRKAHSWWNWKLFGRQISFIFTVPTFKSSLCFFISHMISNGIVFKWIQCEWSILSIESDPTAIDDSYWCMSFSSIWWAKLSLNLKQIINETQSGSFLPIEVSDSSIAWNRSIGENSSEEFTMWQSFICGSHAFEAIRFRTFTVKLINKMSWQR